MKSAAGRWTRSFSPGNGPGRDRWWPSCPARGPRKSPIIQVVSEGGRRGAASGAGGTIRRGGVQGEAGGHGPAGNERAKGDPIEVYVGKTPELMHLADCAMACSGSVSLELLYYTTPTVILYWINRPAYFVQRLFRKVKYITLVNLLAEWEARDQGPGGRILPHRLRFRGCRPQADTMLFPEYLTCEDLSAEIAAHVVEWLTDRAEAAVARGRLARLKEKVAQGGASAPRLNMCWLRWRAMD